MYKKVKILIFAVIVLSVIVFADTTSVIDSLKNVLEAADIKTKAEILVPLSENIRDSSPEQSLKYLEEALELLNSYPDNNLKARVYNDMSRTCRVLKDSKKAMEYAELALELAKAIKDSVQTGEAYSNIGTIYANEREYEKAIEYLTKSLEISARLGDKIAIAKRHNNIGIIYCRREKYDEAIEHYLIALKLNEETGDETQISKNLNNLGLLYYNVKDYKRSLEYYLRSKEMNNTADSVENNASLYNNIGLVYWDMGDLEEALKYYSASLEIYKKLGYNFGIANCLNNMGLVYEKKGDLQEALNYYQESLKIKYEYSGEESVARTLANIGVANYKLKHKDEALKVSLQALQIAEKLNAKSVMVTAHETLSKIYADKGDYESALESLKSQKSIHDSIYSKESTEKIVQIQSKYDTEQKSNEIELLKKEQEIQNLKMKRQMVVKYAFIGGFSGIFILSIILVMMYRKRSVILEELETANENLMAAVSEIELLSSLHPICTKCKNVRDDQGYWNQLEDYFNHHAGTVFSHGICPDCMKELYPDLSDRLLNQNGSESQPNTQNICPS